MNELKDKTTRVLLDYYNKNNNLGQVKLVTKAMIESTNSNPIIRGEICESLLEIMIIDFIKRNHLEDSWILSKGIILKDLDNPDSEYLTELDLTLFTPKKIYLFECKSYKGNKILRDPCKLFVEYGKKESFKMDVYDQHAKHYKALYKYLNKFKLDVETNVKPFKIVFFDFSDGIIRDERSDKFKSVFPVKDENTIYSLFKTYLKEPDQWDMKYVRKVVSLLDENKKKLTSSHLDYVRGLSVRRSSK